MGNHLHHLRSVPAGRVQPDEIDDIWDDLDELCAYPPGYNDDLDDDYWGMPDWTHPEHLGRPVTLEGALHEDDGRDRAPGFLADDYWAARNDPEPGLHTNDCWFDLMDIYDTCIHGFNPDGCYPCDMNTYYESIQPVVFQLPRWRPDFERHYDRKVREERRRMATDRHHKRRERVARHLRRPAAVVASREGMDVTPSPDWHFHSRPLTVGASSRRQKQLDGIAAARLRAELEEAGRELAEISLGA